MSPRPLAQLMRASVAAVAAVPALLQRVKEREGVSPRPLAQRVKETCCNSSVAAVAALLQRVKER